MADDLRCTYRLQLGSGLGFREARALVPYLEELGVSHLYLSPSLQARSGSTHGYDVVDPTRISDDLGGEDEFRALCSAGLGVVLDIVPNHMAASEEQNPFWRDPLWRAKFFDLDWRTGTHRRFFDVGELAGVREEDPEVFETVHAKALSLVREGLVDGLRIDHPDGLANPARYLERLREGGAEHVWVEKILEPGERLRDWPVEGTTGYEFLNDVTALFVDPAGEEPLTRLYREFTGEERPFEVVARECKLREAKGTFSAEAERLTTLLELGAGPVEKVSDTLSALDLAAALASFPVYRTYVDPDREVVTDDDRAAIAAARLDPRLARILLLEERGHDAFGGWRDANEEYLIWQTLVGAWPLPAGRLAAYLEKALREAKVNTAWVDGDPDWERDAIGWATGLLRDERFLADLEPFAARVRDAGRRASLGQLLLKLTCPGVPDVYQGDELGLLALVDPDNRRPVDWGVRRRAIAAPEPGSKLDVIRRTLALRRGRPAAFAGAYEPLDAGPDVCAFTRCGEVCVAVAVRGELDGFRPPPGAWNDVLPRSPWLRLLERV